MNTSLKLQIHSLDERDGALPCLLLPLTGAGRAHPWPELCPDAARARPAMPERPAGAHWRAVAKPRLLIQGLLGIVVQVMKEHRACPKLSKLLPGGAERADGSPTPLLSFTSQSNPQCGNGQPNLKASSCQAPSLDTGASGDFSPREERAQSLPKAVKTAPRRCGESGRQSHALNSQFHQSQQPAMRKRAAEFEGARWHAVAKRAS